MGKPAGMAFILGFSKSGEEGLVGQRWEEEGQAVEDEIQPEFAEEGWVRVGCGQSMRIGATMMR